MSNQSSDESDQESHLKLTNENKLLQNKINTQSISEPYENVMNSKGIFV